MESVPLGWSIVKNTVAQIVGRILIALSRLVIAGIIVRGLGKEAFGEYSLVIVMLSIAEWVLDFGSSDFFVREVCREPERKAYLLRVMTGTRLAQLPPAVLLLGPVMIALQYPARIIEAAMIASVGLLFFAGVLAYRVVFRATLTIEREVGAEFVSVIVLIALTAAVLRRGGGLSAAFVCYVLSRAVFFGACILAGRRRFVPSVRGVRWIDVARSMRSAAPLGAIGLLVVVYETVDVLLLSRFGSLSEVAFYSGAQRFVWPFLTCLSSLAGTLYPVLARLWPTASGAFEIACQRGMEAGLALSGLAICSILAAPDFLLGLLGPTLASGGPVAMVLALLLFPKAVSTMLGPALYVARAQNQVLRIVIAALLLKVCLIAAVAPRFGAIGVALSCLAADLLAACYSVWLVRSCLLIRLRWLVSLRILAIAILTPYALRSLSFRGAVAVAAGAACYVPLLFAARVVQTGEVRELLRLRTA